ncbi:HU family DNA-binding protein [Acidovorax sp. sif1233]|jgi:nucleoid DNA-binding protein|uniref:HU family DNA-binding protein n=1 Tax=unclassified Acidovorax TaxID=2684926 RepID=UPI001C440224|nr:MULTISPECIES: HU family DNA-binding protein [unclassified Acidovorax]MBV7428229.1 HU family DNA-binding protein [Acidovorax sp. sif0732]MBV7449486.1 HU family DNA-binding protein [Acidovorax sp. sif0715]MBV7455955.1 HU family DNA-binding protein [Acidovorax sp. sif1233]
MATAKKTPAPAKKTVKAAAPAAAKKAAPAAKKAAAPAKKAAAPAAKKAAAPVAKPVAVGIKPIKTAFNKTTLIAHLAEQAGVEPKATKAVLAALEATILGSVHKKGSGEFTLPGLMKIGLQQIPAKKKRFGKDPFTGEERWFPAKPAAVKIKTRALKKLKDATA